ncbi:phosphatidylinositol-specific phospholipase C [Flammeovirgaceae bacterium SG7u.111]|nr:phosphatidylinositol-specific phospholipase C [Flammeovirgaceae bacterium SG7u.132]WPO34448.1 phosphatidylinositol-specific phospholipase C [Flammeovirgaceae bacterium SG7u.111]
MMRKLLKTLLVALVLLQSCQEDEIKPNTIGQEEEFSNEHKSAVYSLSNWMGAIDGNLILSQFTIPGTHDSGARFDHAILSGTAKCQDLTIGQQLESGTRFLDIRCRHYYDSFTIHHGVVYQQMNFDDVLNYCFNFLDANPSETIIMSVKKEHTDEGNTQSFEATFDGYVAANPNRWYLAENVPALKDVRGKIVLLRRFGASNIPKGINASAWQDNTTFEMNTSQANIKVQDKYTVPNNNDKWNDVEGLLNEAKANSSDKLYINFESGYKPGWFGIPSIPTVSNFINPKIEGYFTPQKYGRFGILVMDFAESTKNNLIVQSNFQ